MKERGIIFCAPMIIALLDGRKTATRRVCKLPNPRGSDALKYCPHGQVGDRLWVREAWAAQHRYDDRKPSEIPPGARLSYRADSVGPSGLVWRTPLFMPRQMSRITLELAAIRIERLNDITEEDARAEGVERTRGILWGNTPHRRAFYDLWEALNNKRAPWSSNPWVFALSFKRICQCESEIEVPQEHLPVCRFADPTHEETPF